MRRCRGARLVCGGLTDLVDLGDTCRIESRSHNRRECSSQAAGDCEPCSATSAQFDAMIEPLRHQIALVRAEEEREQPATADLASARLLAAYLEANRRRLRIVEIELARLEQARAAGHPTHRATLELKRLDCCGT